MIAELLVGIGLGVLLGWLGYRLGLLSPSGAAGVWLVIAVTFGVAGWTWGGLPLLYFLSAAVLSRYGAPYKAKLAERFVRDTKRAWHHILGSAGWVLILVLFRAFAPHNIGVYAAFVGAIATVSADTWATELGVLSARPPWLITSRKPVPAGTPGGLSVIGSVAALAAAWMVGFLGLLFVVIEAWLHNLGWTRILVWLPLAATLGGIAGCLVDSLLGASAQGMYYCEKCQQFSEYPVHSCGEKAQQVRGWSWLTNDGVNLVSSVVGAAVTAGIVAWLAQTIV